MSERIKELLEQTNCWKPLGLPSDWDEDDYVVSLDQMQKFAELIVQECLTIDFASRGCIDLSAADQVREIIKQHFGIKEC